MPTILTNDDTDVITVFPLAIVQTKNTLADEEWQNTTNVYCDKLTLDVNAYDEAELSRDVGDMVQPGTNFFAEYAPLNIVGKFVKITIPTPDDETDIEWVGYVQAMAKQRSAVKGADPAANHLTGRKQVFSAVGLEYFLDRVQVDSAHIFKQLPEEPGPGDKSYTKILRTIPFNGGKGVGYDADAKIRGNRCESPNPDGIYAFVPADEDGELWTLADIVIYLTEYFTTRNKADEVSPIRFFLSPTDEAANVLDGVAPTIDPFNMTVFQLLNRLLSPQRGFVWWLEFKQVPFGVAEGHIRVETLAQTAITLPSLGTIPANRDQQTLDFDKQRSVDDVLVAEAGSRVYHQVIVRGARMTSTCTLGMREVDGGVFELIDDWPLAYEEAYLAAAATTTGYGDLSEKEKAKRNDAFRSAEFFSHVFANYRLDPRLWDGKSGDGADGERNWTFPVLSPEGAFVDGLACAVNGLRFRNQTRLKRGWSYEDIEDITRASLDISEGEYLPSFAILRVSTAESGGEHDKYQFVEKMGQHDFAEGDLVSDRINVSYYLSMQSTVPGIVLNAAGVQHACALNHWVAAEPTVVEPQVDFDTLRVTTTIEADTYCEARFPEDADLPAGVPLQRLQINVGDEYRLDFIAGNTVFDLSNGEPVLSDGGILRDDRKRLQDIARVAYEWYRTDRRPLTVVFKQIRNLWRLGMLIYTVGEGTTQETINTVVSVISFDLVAGTTTLKTQDADLELARIT